MKIGVFFSKLKSRHLWGNLAAMALLITLIILAVRYGLDFYTNHGKVVEVPNLIHKSYGESVELLDEVDLQMVVSDTGYVKSLPADCILEQSLAPGSGRAE